MQEVRFARREPGLPFWGKAVHAGSEADTGLLFGGDQTLLIPYFDIALALTSFRK